MPLLGLMVVAQNNQPPHGIGATWYATSVHS